MGMIEANPMGRRAFLGFAATGAAGILVQTIARPQPKVFDMGRGLSRAAPPDDAFCVYGLLRGDRSRFRVGEQFHLVGVDGSQTLRVVALADDRITFDRPLERGTIIVHPRIGVIVAR